jgi:hypothetical protein
MHVVDNNWWIEAEDGNRRITPSRTIGDYAEVSWSPAGNAFFITDSDGYTTGFSTSIYLLKNQAIVPIRGIGELVSRDFELRNRCAYRYERTDVGNRPNIAGLKWIDGGDQVIIVAEVPPVGICKAAGYFAGYQVDLNTRRIVATMDPQDLAKNFGQLLGWRLQSDYRELTESERLRKP